MGGLEIASYPVPWPVLLRANMVISKLLK